MNSDRGGFGAINSFAVRIAHFASRVVQAHQCGYGPGRHTEPWSDEFQRLAALVYAGALPPAYRRGIADSSSRVAELMDGNPDDAQVGDAWHAVRAYLRSTARALLADPDVEAIAPKTGATQIAATPPAHLRHEVFAELLHPRGARRLADAATAVARYCEARLPAAPTAQEIEWIIAVAAREPIAALANRNATTTRGMYRRLGSMWKRLGVANQVQGVALAVQQGWIMPPSHTPAEQQSRPHRKREPVPTGKATAPAPDRWKTVPNAPLLLCLQGLANGTKQERLAQELGYSKRQLQRMLADLWTQLEVPAATQGVAHAAAQGWITIERTHA